MRVFGMTLGSRPERGGEVRRRAGDHQGIDVRLLEQGCDSGGYGRVPLAG